MTQVADLPAGHRTILADTSSLALSRPALHHLPCSFLTVHPYVGSHCHTLLPWDCPTFAIKQHKVLTCPYSLILHSHPFEGITQPRTLRDQLECCHCCKAPKTERITIAGISTSVSQSCRHCEVTPHGKRANFLFHPERKDINEKAQQQLWLSTAGRSGFIACPSYPQY
ncbi:hypothetical protein Pelo_16572 [Pelomyxa schiedti]|nr:hypothetical protein Pelo_16572 [Pelomyxa schiedti]